MNKLVRNESIKLFANWLNGLSITVLAAGVVAPVASISLGLSAQPKEFDQWVSFAVICMCISGALHLSAQLVISGLSNDT